VVLLNLFFMRMNPDADELFADASSPVREHTTTFAAVIAVAATLGVLVTALLKR
jgi:hypothetical protein